METHFIFQGLSCKIALLQRRQLNWYFSLSALTYDHTVNKMTSHMIHICHMQIALFSG